MKLTVVIVSYKVRYFVEQCIVSVQRAVKGLDAEIYVVDNHSDDGTVEFLTQRFGPAVTLIESAHNVGFARANNIAIRQSASEYVLLLNPDTFVAEDSIKTVLQFMDDHPKAGGAGVMMHNANGTVARESRRSIPTPFVSLLKMLCHSARYYMSHLPWDRPGRIDVMSGAFCMLRREALAAVGLLDEDFFMYGEDIDLSYRILKGGYENWYVPTHIVHYKGESTQKSSFRYVHVFYQAMLIFFRKHYGHLSLFVTLPIRVAIYARAAIALLQMQYGRLRSSLGFVDPQAENFEYVFVGSRQMLDECQKLARQKGLLATFVSKGDPLPATGEGHCIVYDTDAFTFAEIIGHAAQNGKAETGTYSCASKTLITSREVIR